MVKLLLVASLITGISWYKDKINCIVPGSHGISGGFVSSACWIQGVYVFKELQGNLPMKCHCMSDLPNLPSKLILMKISGHEIFIQLTYLNVNS